MPNRRFLLFVGCLTLLFGLRSAQGAALRPLPALASLWTQALPTRTFAQTTPLRDQDEGRWRAWQALAPAV